MGTKRVGWARIKSLINENTNALQFRNNPQVVLSLTKDTTLSAADSGKLIVFTPPTSAGALDITLPAAASGLHFTIIQAKDYDTADCTVEAAAGEYMAGAVAGPSAASQNLANGSNHVKATFGSDTLAGDQITLRSDGTLWYVSGTAAAGGANGITFST